MLEGCLVIQDDSLAFESDLVQTFHAVFKVFIFSLDFHICVIVLLTQSKLQIGKSVEH